MKINTFMAHFSVFSQVCLLQQEPKINQVPQKVYLFLQVYMDFA